MNDGKHRARRAIPYLLRHWVQRGFAQLVSYLYQNLELVLKPDTAPTQFWVVDHVEIPTEN